MCKSVNDIYLRSAFALLLLLCCSCNKNKGDALSPRDYVSWVEDPDNGLKLERTFPPITYSVQYKPYDYIIAKEEKSNSISKSTFESQYKAMDKMQYYSLRIQTAGNDLLKEGSPSQQEYYQRQNYLTFEFQGDIQLVDGGDTLSPALFQMVGNYGLAPYVDFVMGFTTKDKLHTEILQDKYFILEDKVFGNGILKFIVKKEAINKTPEIKTL
jgi:hypothetical protein